MIDLPISPPDAPLRVLLIEDSEDDAALVLRELRRGGYEVSWARVDTAESLRDALQRQTWDLILCDYVMPDFSALAALDLLRERGGDTPSIIVSGQVGEEVAAATLRAGALDYVNKNNLARLVPAVERELREAEVRRAGKQAEQALRESEQRFRFLIENSLDIIAILNADGTYRYASPAHEHASGFTPEELVGRNGFDFIHPDDAPRLLALLAQGLIAGRATAVVEYRFRHKDGSWRYVEGAARNLTGDAVINGVIINARDISERKRTEEALRESEERYRTLVENLNDVIFTLDATGRITYVSPSLQRMFRMAPGHMTGKTFLEFIHPDDRAQLLASFHGTLGGQVEPSEFRVLDKQGQVRWLRTSSRPRYEGERLVGVTGVMTDITDRKQAEQQLRDSEEHYRSLIAAMAEGVVLQTAEGAITACNASAARILGLSADQMMGRTSVDPRWHAIHEDGSPFPGEDHPAMRTLGSGQPCTGVIMGVRKPDGSLTWVSINSQPLFRSAAQQPYAVVTTFADITERKRVEAALIASEARFRTLADNFPDTVARFDRDLRCVYVNSGIEDITGRPPAAFVGKTFVEADLPVANIPVWEASFREIFATVRPGVLEWTFSTPDGERCFESRLVPELDKDGAVEFVLATCRDITTRRDAEDEIRRLNAELETRVRERTMQLEAANRELEAFSFSVSHDLRAPLRTIAGFSTALLEECTDRLDPRGQEYVERIRSGTERMQHLVEDLLGLSRVSRAEMRWGTVDLSAMAQAIAAELQRAQPERTVEVVVAPALVVRGDARLLRVVLENLFGNAWKYTSRRATAHIEFGVIEQSGEPVYFLRDDGAGFDMAWIGKLFRAFQRLHHAHEFEGTGIGLATVQRIIHRHHGRIWAEAAVDRGATFYFTLGADLSAVDAPR